MATQQDEQPKLYFSYGSNLWHDQMSRRCPNSVFQGLARLRRYRWIINTRGYANIVASNSADEVFGSVYSLDSTDEYVLDGYEGVPQAYTKETIIVDFWSSQGQKIIDITAQPQQKEVLVYIDKLRIEDSKPKLGYVQRMNDGLQDALSIGMPQAYVDKVLRRLVPKDETKDG